MTGPRRRVVVFDYGSGNVHSAVRALERVGAARLAHRRTRGGPGRRRPVRARGRQLPRRACADSAAADGRRASSTCGSPAGGRSSGSASGCRCSSTARPSRRRPPEEGLGEWPGMVDRLPAEIVPHMGWSTVAAGADTPAVRRRRGRTVLLRPLVCGAGLELVPAGLVRRGRPGVTWATHGADFVAAVENGPLCATQFHPEKSGDAGAQLLENWVQVAVSGSRLELLPAVDIADGRAVRLVQGVAGSGGEFGDPLDAALAWQEQGAEWIHLVDLDAAFGRGSNRELLAEIVGGSTSRSSCPAASATPSPSTPRSPPAAAGSTSAPRPWSSRSGPPRRSPGTATGSRSASTCGAPPSRPAAGPRTAATSGRRWPGSTREGCARYVVTDVNKDGMLAGPNLDLLREVCERTDAPGRRLRRGLDAGRRRGAAHAGRRRASRARSSGSALYRGAFTLPEALDVAGRP